MADRKSLQAAPSGLMPYRRYSPLASYRMRFSSAVSES
jgi:hypothetical protein